MNPEVLEILQQRVSEIKLPHFNSLHNFEGVPKSFIPWECGLSPSELYSRSLPLRKKTGVKAIEVKWTSIKRWSSVLPCRIELPPGVFFSIKRREVFFAAPKPHYEKIEYGLVMLPYGNVWSQVGDSQPIVESWLLSDAEDGKLMIEHIMNKDAANPIIGYWKSAFEQWKKESKKQKEGKDNLLWIHTKRKKPIR